MAGYGAGVAAATTSNLDIQLTYFGADALVHANYVHETDMAAVINAASGMCLFDVCTAVKAATRGAIAVTGATATCSKGAVVPVTAYL
jgi:hypothetical protein